MAVSVKPAATLVLLRPAQGGEAGQGTEVLLLRRHAGNEFMGGVCVFPGGRLDEADFDEAYEEVMAPMDWRALAERFRLEPQAVRAHFVAVLRETFEESGALLASPRGRPEEMVELDCEELAGRFARYRGELNDRAHPRSLLEIARAEALLLRPDRLCYFDHWITPEVEQRRYDTRFFAAAMPAGQTPEHEGREATQSRWLSPAAALAEYEAGRILLAPPTIVTLRRLGAYPSVEASIEGLRDRPVVTMLPRPRQVAGELHLVLPGHPDYGEPLQPLEGLLEEGAPRGFTLRAGKWRPL